MAEQYDDKLKNELSYTEDAEAARAARIPGVGDKQAERAIVRKLDKCIMPMAFILQLLCSIDRASIGNAKVAGLEKDLKLVGYEYNIALTLFYIAFLLVEVPSNLLLKRWGAHIVLPALVIGFGVVTTLTSVVKDFTGLAIIRFALGLTEGGVMPGLAAYLARFYRRDELVLRVGIFVAATAVAVAFGGLLASAILTIDSIGWLTSWRLIFLIEGILTTGLGILMLVAAKYLFPREPLAAKFLTEEERIVADARIKSESAAIKHAVEKTDRELVWRAFKNANVFFGTMGMILVQISVQGLSLFMPTIIRSLFPGRSVVQVQLLSCPPFILATFTGILSAWMSDKFRRRGLIVAIFLPWAILGYILFVATRSGPARYAGAFLCAGGALPIGPIFISWAANNTSPDTTRAVGSGIVVGMASVGSIIATWSYLPNDGPNYLIGNGLNVASTSLLLLNGMAAWGYNSWENRQRAAGKRDHRLVGKTEAEIQKLGCYHPEFKLAT